MMYLQNKFLEAVLYWESCLWFKTRRNSRNAVSWPWAPCHAATVRSGLSKLYHTPSASVVLERAFRCRIACAPVVQRKQPQPMFRHRLEPNQPHDTRSGVVWTVESHRTNLHPSNAPSVRLARRGGPPVAPELCAPADGQREHGPLRLVVQRPRQSYVYCSFNSSHVFGFHSRANRWASAICWGVIKLAS